MAAQCRCLFKLWEMFHEHNYGRVLDKQKFVEQLAKLKAEYVKLCTEYIKLVEDVGKMFDWQNGRVDTMDQKKVVEEEEGARGERQVGGADGKGEI